MSINPIVPDNKISYLLNTEGRLTVFNPENKPFFRQQSMLFRTRGGGKMNALFQKGPHRQSVVLTPDESWVVNGMSLETLRYALRRKGLYGFLSYFRDEGCTLWCLTPDEKWADKNHLEELNSIIKGDIKNRKWMSAYNKALKSNGDSMSPFAITFATTITTREIPFFGRVAWGISLTKGIISLVQIPLMDGNRDSYFSWLYVPKDQTMTEDDFTSRFGKGGGESDYSKFKTVRDYLEKECEPLSTSGNYSFTISNTTKDVSDSNDGDTDGIDDTDNDGTDSNEEVSMNKNPLIQAYNAKKEESYYAVKEALSYAVRYSDYTNSSKYVSEDRGDTDEDVPSPKGEPYQNKLPLTNKVPSIGPMY